MKKYITYHFTVGCEVTSKGCVIPCSSRNWIEDDKKGENLNMAKYPDANKIFLIWLGKYYSYPFMNEK